METPEEILTINGVDTKASYYQQGVIRIKIDEEFFKEIEQDIDKDGNLHFAEVKSMAGLSTSMKISQMRRTFPPAGEFEERTRAEGLHLWFDITFDEEVSLTKAGNDLNTLDGVNIVEYRPIVVHIKSDPIPEAFATNPFDLSNIARAAELPFDDPGLSKQWHYYNPGGSTGYEAGSDINIMPVWKGNYVKGDPEIIVSVVDGGIDFNHEDLKDNMWHNPGKTGDMKYGFNFVQNNYGVTPDDHGTHVAGTVAAVNNNGIGVSGVAGGDYAKGVSGIKLMSCQIFEGDKSGDGAEAIKWGADNGAVISQNSWGYLVKANLQDTPASDKAAIDYFNKYAGLNSGGQQVGPMSGGIVIFAAGNDNMDIGYPGAYEGAVAVASVGADYRRAYYSNYGDWCDVAAPGGDAKKGPQVYSTMPGNSYGYMQGTSMACPHVSGIAAITLANKAAPGFTAEKLRQIIESSVKSISKQNPNFYIGMGLVDTYMAIASGSGTPPKTPTDFTATAKSNNIAFSLTIPEDKDDGIPSNIIICYSKNKFSKPNQATREMFSLSGYKAGETFRDTVRNVAFNQLYYVAAIAIDPAGNQSSMTKTVEVNTTNNNPPTISFPNGKSITVKAAGDGVLRFNITEPDNHTVEAEFTPGSEAATLKLTSNTLGEITILGPKAPAGTYNGKVVIKDFYGLKDSSDFSYTILPNHAPKVVKEFGDIIFNSKTAATMSFNIMDYIQDEDGDPLTYTSVSTDNTIANVNIVGDKVHVTPMSYGACIVDLTAKDALDASATAQLRILVRDDSVPVDIYPNPVTEYMYIRTGKVDTVSIKVTSSSGSTVFQESNLTVDPFTPHKIDVTGWSGGTYLVEVKTSEDTLKRTIVKL